MAKIFHSPVPHFLNPIEVSLWVQGQTVVKKQTDERCDKVIRPGTGPHHQMPRLIQATPCAAHVATEHLSDEFQLSATRCHWCPLLPQK